MDSGLAASPRPGMTAESGGQNENCWGVGILYFSVIPGRRNAPSPESITTIAGDGTTSIPGYPIDGCGYGFRARALRVPE
jgi:hypothetical protein